MGIIKCRVLNLSPQGTCLGESQQLAKTLQFPLIQSHQGLRNYPIKVNRVLFFPHHYLFSSGWPVNLAKNQAYGQHAAFLYVCCLKILIMYHKYKYLPKVHINAINTSLNTKYLL